LDFIRKMSFIPTRKYINYLIVALLLITFLGNFRTYMVMGDSDLPTFISGDKVIINRSAYDVTLPFTSMKIIPWRAPSRGDMILCYLKKRTNGNFWLKRIIGIPGDTIQIKSNKIYINNSQLKYEVLKRESISSKYIDALGEIVAVESGFGLEHTVSYSDTENIISNFGPLVVSEAHYFVLGDNRFNSFDSRFLGQVPRQNIFGKFLFRIYRRK